MIRFNKHEREKYGISIEKMSELSGLTKDRVKEVEKAYLSLVGSGVPRERLVANADSERMFSVVDEIKKSQDKIVEEMLGRFIANGISISLKYQPAPPAAWPFYVAEISRSTDYGSLCSTGRGASPLKALTRAVEAMRDASGVVSGLVVEASS